MVRTDELYMANTHSDANSDAAALHMHNYTLNYHIVDHYTLPRVIYATMSHFHFLQAQ